MAPSLHLDFDCASQLKAQCVLLPALIDVQRNLTKIEGNVRELEAKLKHEQDKFKTYNKDLKEAENRYAHTLASV